jgi:hypothetical protein
MKLLEGFWNFHVWNTKPLLFMLDFIRQSLGSLGGRYMICLVWLYLDLVYQLECLLYMWHENTMFFGFHFFWFFLNFDAHLNLCQILGLTKIWTSLKHEYIWKGKHVCFLVTPKWSSWKGFLKFPCLKPKTTSLHAWLHKTEFRVRGSHIHVFFGLNMSRPCIST